MMDADLVSAPKDEILEDSDENRQYRCKACGNGITSESYCIEKSGSWKHVFTNPAGYVYEIGCFRSAPGCSILGEYSSEFSWFKGYLWAYSICGACFTHLGWHFSGRSGSDFHGLILGNLTV